VPAAGGSGDSPPGSRPRSIIRQASTVLRSMLLIPEPAGQVRGGNGGRCVSNRYSARRRWCMSAGCMVQPKSASSTLRWFLHIPQK
jgi:hypothetical protein